MATINVLDSVGATVAIEKPLTPGRAAAASSRPIALSTEDLAVLDGLEGLLGTIDADTGGILTSVQLLDNAISGSEMQVDIVGALPAGTNMIGQVRPEGTEYETVAASQTAQVLGPTGAIGDYLSGLLVIPATTAPGNVLLLDNATSITVFAGGASSVTTLIPFFIPLGITSVSGAWKVTTGTNVSVIGVGNFT